MVVSTTLSVALLINGEYSFNRSSSLWSDVRRESACEALSAGWDGQLRIDVPQYVQKIVTLNSPRTFQ